MKLSRLPSLNRSDASRRVTGTSARSPRGGSSSPRESSNSRRPPVAAASTTSVIDAAEVVTDRLQLVQRGLHDGVPARLADRHVQ